MPIEFRCGQCHKLLRTNEDKAGLAAQCPGCGADVVVPDLPEQPFSDGSMDELEIDFEENPSSRRRKKCPMCGQQVQPGADRCRNCGELLETEDQGWYSPTKSNADLKPHRGVVLMVISILSWFFFCFLLAIPVWILADQDLKSMQAGVMDSEGEGLTRGAKIIAICNVALVGFMFVAFCCLGVIGSAVQPR